LIVDRRRNEGSDTGGGEHPAAGDAFPRPGSSDLGLGGGAEFDLIRRFYGGGAGASEVEEGVRVGAGDDAAVVGGEGIVLSVDLSLEGVHFRREWLDPREIGRRAAVAALSDLAAMAARPIGVLVSLAATPEDAALMAVEIMGGVRAALGEVGGVLLGGDLTRAPAGIVLDVVAVGEAPRPLLRRGASAGDEIWVTGSLGGAAIAVANLLRGETPDPEARERYAAPNARIAEAFWLAARGIPTAMIDLSDGLAGDASHIARASGVAMVLESSLLPVHAAVLRVLGAGDEAARLAMGGGEDYEICFTAPPGAVEPHLTEFLATFSLPLTRLGWVEEGAGVHVLDGRGKRSSLDRGGFQHFG